MTTSWMPSIDVGADTNLLRTLLATWKKRQRMNMRRSLYYDGEAALKDFGISLPPQMRNVSAALGWIGKGTRALTNRSEFAGFVTTSGSSDPLDIGQLMWDNQFQTEFPASCISSAMHGCSFITVTNGDLDAGEPDVLMTMRSAESSAAIWDNRRRAVGGFLSIIATGEDRNPTSMVLYTAEHVRVIERTAGAWKSYAIPHHMGEVPAYQLVHNYELRRPLGKSRISRAAMYFSDAALRTIVRSEVSAEFYSAPEYWLFGSAVESFIGDNKWSAIMGRIKAKDIDTVADEKPPELQRFTGASPQPHTDQLRMWAAQFADEMDLDVRFADSANPSSAEAIFAAKESLITDTKTANRSWGFGAVRAMNAAIRLRDGRDVDSDEMRSLRAQFTDPVLVSPSARADAFSKFAANIPGFAESEVGLEYGGLSPEQILRFQAEQSRARGANVLDRALELNAQTGGETNVVFLNEADEARAKKAKFDALGVAIRAGVDPENAAEQVGLTGLKFTGATPVALRLPKEDAAAFEQ